MLDLDWKEKSKPITELPLHLLTLFCKHQDEGIDYREKLKQSRVRETRASFHVSFLLLPVVRPRFPKFAG